MRVQVYLHNNWGISTVGAGVEGRGAGLAVRDVGGAEEVRELGQQVVSVVRAVQRHMLLSMRCGYIPGTNVQTLDLQARDGQINETLLDDVQGDGGAGLDGGG